MCSTASAPTCPPGLIGPSGQMLRTGAGPRVKPTFDHPVLRIAAQLVNPRRRREGKSCECFAAARKRGQVMSNVPPSVRDVSLLLSRLVLGIVFVAHGWQKFSSAGMTDTAAQFGEMGVPLPTLSAWFSATVELVGGFALVAGLLTPVFGVLLTIDMLGAFLFVHMDNGLFAADNGYEIVAGLGAASLLVASFGAGRYSIDAFLSRAVRQGRLEMELTSRSGGPALGG